MNTEFDAKRLRLYHLWHEYLAEILVHTANDLKTLAELGDLEGVEARCAELLAQCKALRANGDRMAQIELLNAHLAK